MIHLAQWAGITTCVLLIGFHIFPVGQANPFVLPTESVPKQGVSLGTATELPLRPANSPTTGAPPLMPHRIQAYIDSLHHSHSYRDFDAALEVCDCGALRPKYLDESIHPKEVLDECFPHSTSPTSS